MRVQMQSFIFSIHKKIMRLKGLNFCNYSMLNVITVLPMQSDNAQVSLLFMPGI